MNTTPFDISSLMPKDPVVYEGTNGIDVISRDGRQVARHSRGAPGIAVIILDETFRILLLRKVSPLTGYPTLEFPKWYSDQPQEPEIAALEGVRSICGISPHLDDVVSLGLIYPDASHLSNATNILFTRVDAVLSDFNLHLEDGTQPVYLSFSQARKHALEDGIQDAATIAGIFRLSASRR